MHTEPARAASESQVIDIRVWPSILIHSTSTGTRRLRTTWFWTVSTDPTDRPDPPAVKDRQTPLERALIDEFLRTHGYDPANVSGPPNAEIELLMKQACTYASGKLAEVEARAQFVHDIHGGVEDVHKPRHR